MRHSLPVKFYLWIWRTIPREEGRHYNEKSKLGRVVPGAQNLMFTYFKQTFVLKYRQWGKLCYASKVHFCWFRTWNKLSHRNGVINSWSSKFWDEAQLLVLLVWDLGVPFTLMQGSKQEGKRGWDTKFILPSSLKWTNRRLSSTEWTQALSLGATK